MSLKQFIKEKEDGFPKSVYLLYGTDPFFLKEAETAVKESVDATRREFDLDVYDLNPSGEKAASLKDIIDSLNTYSFFSEKKAVIVQNIRKLKQAETSELKAYLADPSGTSTLFLFYNDVLKPGKRKEFAGCHIISLDHNRSELKTWLAAYANNTGTRLSGRVIEYMIGVLGNDAGLLAREVDKLSLLGKESIDIRELEDIMHGEAGGNTFEFTKAIMSGDGKKAFTLSRELRHSDPNMLLGAVNWQVSTHGGGHPAGKFRLYRSLLEADTANKSTGSTYPLELLVAKLLGR